MIQDIDLGYNISVHYMRIKYSGNFLSAHSEYADKQLSAYTLYADKGNLFLWLSQVGQRRQALGDTVHSWLIVIGPSTHWGLCFQPNTTYGN